MSVLHHPVVGHRAVGGSSHHHRDFPVERHLLLYDQPVRAQFFEDLGEHLDRPRCCDVAGGDADLAFAVVAASGRFDNHRRIDICDRGGQLGRAGRFSIRRYRRPGGDQGFLLCAPVSGDGYHLVSGPDRNSGVGGDVGQAQIHILPLPGDDVGAGNEALYGCGVIEGGWDLDVGHRAGRGPVATAG